MNKRTIQEKSRTRLSKEVKKRIETTMIGALASIEKYFGDLWCHNCDERSPRQALLKNAYEVLRSEILDRGNKEIREIQAELQDYDIEWKKMVIAPPLLETFIPAKAPIQVKKEKDKDNE